MYVRRSAGLDIPYLSLATLQPKLTCISRLYMGHSAGNKVVGVLPV